MSSSRTAERKKKKGRRRHKAPRGDSRAVIQLRADLMAARETLRAARPNLQGHKPAVHNRNIRELRRQYEEIRINLAQQILIDRIRQTDIESLSLVSRSFVEIPDLKALQNLTHLDISFNIVEFLEDDFFATLPHLQVFKAVQNKLDAIPESIEACAGSLQVFDVRWNFLRRLPHGLFKCKELKDLQCSYNQIDELPASVTTLTNLQKLILDANKMSSLPSFAGLRALKVLAMSKLGTYGVEGTQREGAKGKNKFVRFPEDIDQCVNLVELYAARNQIKEIPPLLCTSLTKLTKLSLCGNNIQTVPQEFASLRALTHCDLSRNRISKRNFLLRNWGEALKDLHEQNFLLAGNKGINSVDDIVDLDDLDGDAADDMGEESD